MAADSLPPCRVPGCVALATKGPLCAAHHYAQAYPERLWTTGNQARNDFELFVPHAIGQLRQDFPGLARHLVDVERVPLPMPALLDFQFFSPRATLLIADDLAGELLAHAFAHEIVHLREQVRRFRRSEARGLVDQVDREHGAGEYAPWADVDACRGRDDVRLSSSQLATLAANAPSCDLCNRQPGRLEWFYFVSPAETWLYLQGFAGWMGICGACRKQVALFIDRLN
jgi:hypothetical protein